MSSHALTIHYHRDFDGMVSAAILARVLQPREQDIAWRSVNYDQRKDWASFERGRRFAIVDFHFHPRAEYWFDHHPTTFLTPELRAAYAPSERWSWDEASPSCPPLILRHATAHWAFEVPPRFAEMSHWSDVIDAALFESVDQALFGDTPALRISRALTAAPERDWTDTLVGAMVEGSLHEVAQRPDVERAWERATRNRDKALHQFPPTVVSTEEGVILYDASSNRIRRERFAAFFHHADATFSVGVIPTRSGFHVTAGQNPWNPPPDVVHLGELMETYGGGGHKNVGGVNARDLADARRIATEIAGALQRSLAAAR